MGNWRRREVVVFKDQCLSTQHGKVAQGKVPSSLMTRGPIFFVFTDFILLILSFLAILLILGPWVLPLIFLTYSPLLCCPVTLEYERLVEFFAAKPHSAAKTPLCFSHLGSPTQVAQGPCRSQVGGLMVTWASPQNRSFGDPVARSDQGLRTPV